VSEKDPFAETDDTERTVIRPNPGGRRKAASSEAGNVKQQTQNQKTNEQINPRNSERSEKVVKKIELINANSGLNELNSCASNLFALIGRVRNQAQHPDPDNLRNSVVSEIRKFEESALDADIDKKDIRVARYAICATLDDVILNTPWGGNSSWGMQSMVGTFHKETVGGDRFFDLLNRLQEDASNNLNVLEFIYFCLSLGFEGRLRIENGGRDKHLKIRRQLARIIKKHKGEFLSELSPQFEGEDNQFIAKSIWKPFWISSSLVLAFLTIIFMTFIFLLSGKTERFIGEISFANSNKAAVLSRKAPPPPPPPPIIESAQLAKIENLFKKDISQGKIVVLKDSSTITLRLPGAKMFKSGSDKIESSVLATLTRVGLALNQSQGPILVIGHSDNVPISSARFSSNRQLSLARAQSVLAYISIVGSQGNRLSAEGRADNDPIASNDTNEGRAKNRRIEIILLRSN
jgi:type VI secretion system protein ImpK